MDIKSQLKEAREAIDKKDYMNAIEICKGVLNEDKDNYIALVFLGLSIQETTPSNTRIKESENAFRKAIEINSDNLLAWNGLANYFEKFDTAEAKLELIKIYAFLIGKETNEKKLIDYCEKLCALYKYTNVEDICKVIYNRVEKGNLSETALACSRSSMATILKETNDLSQDILVVYEDILSNLVSNTMTVTPDYYSQYLMVLYKLRKLDLLMEETLQMYKMYPEDITSMNWICKMYNECHIENKLSLILSFTNIEEVYEKLLVLEPQNSMGLLTKAVCDVKNGNLVNAKKCLRNIVAARTGLIHAWVLLTRVNIFLHCYNDASESAMFAYKLMQTPKCVCDNTLKLEMQKLYLEALSRSSEIPDWERVINYYPTLDEKYKPNCLHCYIRANIKLDKIAEAKKCIKIFEESPQCNTDLIGIFKAQLLRKQKKYKEALAILQNPTNQSADWCLEMGITYLGMCKLDECLYHFLLAAKKDQKNFYCFYYLGRCYGEMKNYDKARRCYETSIKFYPSYSKASMELSKIYRILKQWDANSNLLRTITKDRITKQNVWAWLQMGLNLMEQGDNDTAVDYLKMVSRIDSENAHCWEALADAYLSRGGYVSAQKAYERVLEISEDALYPALQIATIKKDLGNLQEAVHDFEALLMRTKNCMLTLTGLAETCVKKAKECFLEQRLGTARDYAQYAVEAVTGAIQQYSELSCLWKILGDCCMIVAKLPNKFCCLMIMKAVDEGTDIEGNKILEREELFQLAAKCYCKASMLIENKEYIWHDLAACYLSQTKFFEDKDTIDDLLMKARAVINQCTAVNPGCWQHWNLLGNIALAFDPPNYALAQHAFIKSVSLDRNCAVAWCNLGVVYLMNSNIKLANRAFAEAQRSDPDYVESWIGQGLLAEIIGNENEAMDLFRHSTSLGFHPEGALGYGDWVCRKITESPLNLTSYVIENLHAIPVACDALTWLTENDSYDSCSWNMLGILKERLGLHLGAAECFRKAVNLSSNEHCDIARINYGRQLIRLGHYQEAVNVCSDVQESSFESGIWYALALYKDMQFKESSSIYLAIAEHLAQDKFSIGDVLACMAIITYVLGKPELAKEMFIESFSQSLPTAKVMYALIALGVLQKDQPLVTLTLNKVKDLEDLPKSIDDFITLLSYVHIYQGNYVKAIRKTSELVHLLPNKSSLWSILALTLLHSLEHMKCPMPYARAANRAARTALKLRNLKDNHRQISKIMCVISSSFSLTGESRAALIAAQKAIHCTPNAKECWMVLKKSLEVFPEKEVSIISNQVLYSTSDTFDHIRTNSIF